MKGKISKQKILLMLRDILVLCRHTVPKKDLPAFELHIEFLTIRYCGFDRWQLCGIDENTLTAGRRNPTSSRTRKSIRK